MKKRALVLLSGGIDSAVALWWARKRYDVTALSFDGSRRPRGEVRACMGIARKARVPHLRVKLPFLQARADGYMPGRNLAYHAAALAIAERRGASVVVAGHNRSDAVHYADAREPFFRRLSGIADGIRIVRPFASMTDAQVARLGTRLGVPLELTWSCYRDGAAPCGRCAACHDRLEALGVLGPESLVQSPSKVRGPKSVQGPLKADAGLGTKDRLRTQDTGLRRIRTRR